MTAKEYLGELRRLDTRIAQLQQEQAALYDHPGTAQYGHARTKSTPPRDRVPELIAKREQLSIEIIRTVDRLICLRHEMVGQIQRMENILHIELLYKRYVEYKPLADIAKETGHTHNYIRASHTKALAAFEQQFAAEIEAYSRG